MFPGSGARPVLPPPVVLNMSEFVMFVVGNLLMSDPLMLSGASASGIAAPVSAATDFLAVAVIAAVLLMSAK